MTGCGMLFDLVAESVSIPAEVENAAVLTDYVVTRRYPGDFEPVDEGECRDAVRLAGLVVRWHGYREIVNGNGRPFAY